MLHAKATYLFYTNKHTKKKNNLVEQRRRAGISPLWKLFFLASVPRRQKSHPAKLDLLWKRIFMTGSFLLLATTIGSALLIGFIPALLTRMRPALAGGLEVTESAVDRLKTGFLLSLIPLMISAGWAVDRFGAKDVLFVGNLLAALGIAALALRPSYHATFWVVLILGVAAACLTCAGIVVMPKAFWDDPNESAASLNFGFLAVGVGALLAPVLCHFFLKRLGFRQFLLVLAFLCLLPASFTVFTPGTEFQRQEHTAPTSTILGEPVLWVAILVMLLYYPLEG
jgi:fucose permease